MKKIFGILMGLMIATANDLDTTTIDLPLENLENLDIPITKTKDSDVQPQETQKEQEELKVNETEGSKNIEEVKEDISSLSLPNDLDKNGEKKGEDINIQYKESEKKKEEELKKEQEEAIKIQKNKELEEELQAIDREDEQEKQQDNSEASQPTKESDKTNIIEKSQEPKIKLEEISSKQEAKQKEKEVLLTQEDFFELDNDDFSLEKQEGNFIIKVLSLDLEAFVSGKTYNEKNQIQTFGVNDNFTQIVSQDGKIQEYKFFQKTSRKNTISNRVKFPLEKIDFDTYKIVMQNIPNFFDVSNCKIIIKKEISAVLNQNKEVIIDLDIKRELRNTTNFKLFLDCPR